jgi:hypothetical protein
MSLQDFFEKNKNIFGKPREGIHSYRLFDFAIIDILQSFLVAFLLHKLFNLNLFNIFLIIILIGIILHKLFNVNTKFNSLIFKN